MLHPILNAWPLLLLATQAIAECSRSTLKQAAARYIAAISVGEIRYLDALSTSGASNITSYTENEKTIDIKTGLLSQPLKIDHTRSTYDTTACATFTELIVTDPKHPYVIGTQIRLDSGGSSSTNGSRISRIDSIVTDAEDWLFSPRHSLHYVLLEDWGEIPAEKRDSRATIQAAADAYLDLFSNKSVVVPWGTPCARLEGGLYTQPGDSCSTGVPDGIQLVNRRYVVDESLGTVDVLLTFGGSRLPDSHEFRVEGGKIRYVHTMTACGVPNCGMDVPDILKQDPGF